MSSLKDKNIIVTGASGGIGNSIVERLNQNGANILATGTRIEKLEELKEKFNNIKILKFDISQHEKIEEFINDTTEKLGGSLDGVINNAGLGGESPLETMSNDAWNLVMDVTLNGAMKMMRAAIPILKETQGVIVNNASVLGWRAQAGQSHYAAAKAGVMALTRCVAMETVEHGIRINAVAPSLAMNPHLAKTSSSELIDNLASQEAYGRGAEPWEVANVILFLASDLSSYMTGEVISVSSQRA